jgi:TPR repeat protein
LLRAVAIAVTCMSIAHAQQEQPGLFESLGKMLQPQQEAKTADTPGGARTLAVAGQERRVALVIGNSAYPGAGALKNPANDANDIAAKLKKLGFDVTVRTDMRHKDMLRSLTDFGDKVQTGTEALFFYAGHGMQVRGKNYLLPIDAEIRNEASASSEAVDVDQLLDKLSLARLSVVILDACRNNPFERRFRGSGQGLAQINAPTGTLIAYATAPGKVAADGDGRNGLYTSELLTAMDIPGIKIEDVFKRVRGNVVKKSNDAQTPWESSSLTGDFYFTFQGPTTVNVQQAPADPEGETWAAAENEKTTDGYQAYLDAYPKGRYATAARIKLKGLQKPVASVAVPAAPTPAQVAASSSPDNPEAAMWSEVKASGARDYIDAYLKQYPKGKYVALAKVELKKLDGREKQNAETYFERGREAYFRSDYQAAIVDIKKAAEGGHSEAQAYLGGMNDRGQGVPINAAEAVKWFRKSAEQGNAAGQVGLGSMYRLGIGVPENAAEAVKWFRKSAEQGNAGGQINLASMYANGQGINKNVVEAVRWLRKAAEQGNAYAQANLGAMYGKGEGVTSDDKEAVKWLRKAAEQGDAMGQHDLAMMYANGRGINKDEAEAVKWLRKSAEQGYADSQFQLGAMYASGRGVPEDREDGMKWVRKAAEQGHTRAQFGVGLAHEAGEGVPKDRKESIKWYRLAAEQGYADAKESLQRLGESWKASTTESRQQ